MQANLEKLQSAMMSVIYCREAQDWQSLPANEFRLMDAAIACGASVDEPDFLPWAAIKVADWLSR
jgi:hypothetical protein